MNDQIKSVFHVALVIATCVVLFLVVYEVFSQNRYDYTPPPQIEYVAQPIPQPVYIQSPSNALTLSDWWLIHNLSRPSPQPQVVHHFDYNPRPQVVTIAPPPPVKTYTYTPPPFRSADNPPARPSSSSSSSRPSSSSSRPSSSRR